MMASPPKGDIALYGARWPPCGQLPGVANKKWDVLLFGLVPSHTAFSTRTKKAVRIFQCQSCHRQIWEDEIG
jgi:hypothetical protein